jgi:ATP-dependent DNA ligase
MATEPSAELIASLAQHVGVMKPGKVDKDHANNVAKLDKLLDSSDWAMEEKIDGCRYEVLGYRFYSSDNVEKTDNFPHLRDFFRKLAMYNLILDGELHYPGKTSQYATHVTGPLPAGALAFQELNGYIHYTIFDMLRSPKANWLIKNTYKERRNLLVYFYNTYVQGTEMEQYIHLVPVTVDNKRTFLQDLLDNGFEGGVLKKLDSLYIMGKKPMWQWMKFKQNDETDLVIIGYVQAKREYTGKNLETWSYWQEINGTEVPVTENHYKNWIGSVKLGAYVDGDLIHICDASGMNQAMREELSRNKEAYIGKVARVTFMEKTTDGFPRHPNFKNLHETKTAKECTWEFS